MIKIGIISNSQAGIKSIQEIQQFRDFKITGIWGSQDKKSEDQYAIEDLLGSSDSIYIDDVEKREKGLIKSVLRKSVDIFLKQPFVFKLSEINELISFQQEADCIVQFFNPYLFHSEILRMEGKLASPRLTEINMTLPQKAKLEIELLHALLYLAKVENSGFRKLDVFALQGTSHFLLNLHIQFISGSVAQLIVYAGSNKQQNSRVSIYQKDESPIITNIGNVERNHSAAEQNALKQFIKGVKQKPAILLSLNDLLQATIILQEIKEKLKYPNISLSD